jgi:hypothetical protein
VGGVGKLAHCHPAMLTVFLQALSDVWIDGALAIHADHPPNAKKWPPDTSRRRFINIASNYITDGKSADRYPPVLSPSPAHGTGAHPRQRGILQIRLCKKPFIQFLGRWPM